MMILNSSGGNEICHKDPAHGLIEITLTILADKGHIVPEIIRLLEWTDHPDHFILVLECPSPCENLVEFIRRHGGSLDEETTRQIMWQAAHNKMHYIKYNNKDLSQGGDSVSVYCLDQWFSNLSWRHPVLHLF
ncbi:serine/threonine-protein kinase pim-2-like [Puntigrus tetrazona]|uniref:serine/threonine-protein kinase pim-2-like n=1 Tax=Puntigrus tetrazona TaxID=1606681 RepID=UPI001C8A6C8E|nr:serine/threonine-protein kinase pim-2-like [Puntigrus tetrazona]